MATLITTRLCFVGLFFLLCSCRLASSQFTMSPSNIEVNETDVITFSCSYPAAIISWTFQGEVIEFIDTRYTISQSNDSSESNVTINADHNIHTGSYSCLATTEVGIFRSNFTITVNFLDNPATFGIVITPDECTTPTVYLGSTVTLTCQAPSGFPTPSVAWFHNRVKIRQGDSPNLDFSSMKRISRINNIQHSNAGDYHCEVTNLIGRRNSTLTVLRVTTPASMQMPRIYLPGLDSSSLHDDMVAPDTGSGVVYAALGRRFSLACRIEPPFPAVNQTRVGWTRNGAGLTSAQGGYTLLVGRCDFDLIISSVQESHQGTYRCVYRVGSEPRSQSVGVVIARIRQSYSIGAEISPSPSPSFPVSPSSPVLVGVGRGVNFTCSLNVAESPPDGEVPVTLRWLVRREGSNDTSILSAEPGRLIVSPPTVVGMASDQVIQIRIEIREIELTDSALYICEASNADNLVTPVLSTVTLTVEDQLPISITPFQPTIFLGTSILLTCTLTSNHDGIVFTWFVQSGSVSATSDSRYKVTSSQNMSTLNITRLELSDVGVVKCMGHDPLHLPVNASTTLIESDSFYILGNKQREMVSAQINQSEIQLLCPLRGVNMAQVSWFRENREVFNGQGLTIRSLENGSSLLTKEGVQLSDEVEFLCKAEQDGVILRLEYQIEVTIPGMIISSPPPTVNVVEGQRVQLDCKVSGRPLPRVGWLFDGKTEIGSLRDSNITDLENGTLLIDPVARRHNGSYSCYISVNGALRLNISMLNVTALSTRPSSEDVLGSLNRVEVILIFTVVGVVLLLLLTAGILMAIVCVAVYRTVASSSGKYVVNNSKDSPDTADFRRQPSLREKKDNSGILSASPTNDIFDTLQSPQHMTFVYDNGSSAAAIQLNTFGGASASMVSEMIESHGSTPLHRGTMGTNSLFSSEEHTSAAALPNFSRDHLTLGDVMGEGEFGPVLMGVASGLVAGQDKTLVAVKVLGHNEEEEEMIDPGLALVEFANQMKLEFPNIACILGMCTEMEPYYIIYEYLDQGDLKKFLLGSRPEEGEPPPLSSQHMHKIVLQVANGMAYLFSQRIIHGDLATRNCLISSDLTVKIADLGIGHDLYNGDYYDNGSQLLPIRWMPPELLVETEEGPSFSLHSDIWSFGVICWEVFSYARLPYDTYNDEEVLSMVPHGSRLRSPSDLCPPETYDIMFDCWNEIPEARPQFAQLYAAILKVEQQVD